MTFVRGLQPKTAMGTGIYSKWNPILDTIGVPKDRYIEIAEFAERVVDYFNPNGVLTGVGVGSVLHPQQNDFEKIIVPLSLQIISRIKDLSKIKFLKAPFYFQDGETISIKENKVSLSIDADMIQSMHGHPAVEMMESHIINEIVFNIDDKIDKGFDILMYLPIQSIKYFTELQMVRINIQTRYSYIDINKIDKTKITFWDKKE